MTTRPAPVERPELTLAEFWDMLEAAEKALKQSTCALTGPRAEPSGRLVIDGPGALRTITPEKRTALLFHVSCAREHVENALRACPQLI